MRQGGGTRLERWRCFEKSVLVVVVEGSGGSSSIVVVVLDDLSRNALIAEVTVCE